MDEQIEWEWLIYLWGEERESKGECGPLDQKVGRGSLYKDAPNNREGDANGSGQIRFLFWNFM